MRRLGASSLLLVLVICAACSSSGAETDASPDDGMRIASFDFAESELLAELYAQSLEAVDVPVVRLGVVGPREIVAPALELGRIDLVPEYLGTAMGFFGATSGSLGADITSPSGGSLQRLLDTRGLVVLDEARAQDANAIFVRTEFAEVENIVTISDLSGRAGNLRFGGPVECPDRQLCLVGLADVYRLEFAEFVPLRSVDLTAAAMRRDEIDVGLAFTTSPVLDDATFTILDDDFGLQPPENVVPVIRQDALDRWGPLTRTALNNLSAALTTQDLRAMNRSVSEGADTADVAAAWLADNVGGP